MKVLFIYFENESIGIEILSAVLKKQGHQTDLMVDPKLFSDPEFNYKFLAKRFEFTPQVLKKIQKFKPDLIAVSVVTDDCVRAVELTKKIKQHFKYIPIVFGGIHPTATPQETIKNNSVDFVIIGEGEEALLELVENLNQPENWSNIKNLYYKIDNKIFNNPIRPLIENLDNLPYPDKDLFYQKVPYLQNRYLILTGRGCPNHCSYCCNNLLQKLYQDKGQYVRKRSVQNVIQELVNAKNKYKIKEILFFDDHFVLNEKWLEEFLQEYKSKIKLPFQCSAIAKYFTSKTVKILKECGYCELIEIGIQSASPRLRQEICQRIDDNLKTKEVIKELRSADISIAIDHIFALPTETLSEQIESAKFYIDIKPDIINTFWLTYYPGTQIVEITQKLGWLTDKDIRDINQGKFQNRYELANPDLIDDLKRSKKMETFFNLLPILPSCLNNFIINKKLYKFLPANRFFSVTLHKIILIFFNFTYKRKAIEKLNKYFYFFRNKLNQ